MPFILFSCSLTNENEFGTDWANHNLKGKVKSETLKVYNVSKKFGELKPGSLSSEAYKHPLSHGYSYDMKTGFYEEPIRMRTFNADGFIATEKFYDEDKKVKAEINYSYREGKLVEKSENYIFSFIPNTHFREEYHYSQTTGKLESRYIYSDSALLGTQTFDYSDNKVTISYAKSSAVLSYEKNRPTMRISYDSVGNEVGVTKYNNHGFIVSYNGASTQEFTYNKFYDPISLKEDIDSYSFTYEYDKMNNWTKRITYKDEEPLFIEIRELSYFED